MISALVFSCGGSGGSAEGDAPVKVSFTVDTPQSDIAKTIAVDASGATYKIYYAAIPQWAGVDFSSIQGQTSAYGTDENPTYVELSGYTAGTAKNIGYFAQGSWKFYAQVRKQNKNDQGNVVSETVLYEGATGVVYINEANNNASNQNEVTINVTRKASAGTATVSIDIEVPELSESGTALTVSYTDGTTSGSIASLTNDTPTKTGKWVRFKGTTTALQAGSYTFTITSKDGSTPVGGAVLAFDLIPGENRTITGTVENGEWQTTLLTINVPTLSIVLSGSATSTTVGGTAITFTCTATATQLATGDAVTYQWYEGNTAKGTAAAGTATENDNETSSSYSFSPTKPGYYYVTCKAFIAGKLTASKMLGVTVNPAPAP